MKRIVVCCDGTWNSPDEMADGTPVATNVVRVAEAAESSSRGVPQLNYYHPGVGTAGSSLHRVFDGATGTGISANILDAYRYVCLHYEPGDELYFFGFSRGAFTVRSLAGLIRNSGVLCRDALDLQPAAFALYRSRSKTTHPRGREATLFRRSYAVEGETPIRFIGVWDTVGALGNPLLARSLFNRANRFHDTDLSSTVQFAYQALAIDEHRQRFQATLWHQQARAAGQTLEQVWFVGAHSNVGGGYADHGLSDLALDWMAEKARACGLGLGPMAIEGQPTAPKTESRKSFYRLQPFHLRPIDVPEADRGATNEALHPSVLERYRSDSGYRPDNLEDYLRRHPEVLSQGAVARSRVAEERDRTNVDTDEVGRPRYRDPGGAAGTLA